MNDRGDMGPGPLGLLHRTTEQEGSYETVAYCGRMLRTDWKNLKRLGYMGIQMSMLLLDDLLFTHEHRHDDD